MKKYQFAFDCAIHTRNCSTLKQLYPQIEMKTKGSVLVHLWSSYVVRKPKLHADDTLNDQGIRSSKSKATWNGPLKLKVNDVDARKSFVSSKAASEMTWKNIRDTLELLANKN